MYICKFMIAEFYITSSEVLNVITCWQFKLDKTGNVRKMSSFKILLYLSPLQIASK
jgi:hypothetical protein